MAMNIYFKFHNENGHPNTFTIKACVFKTGSTTWYTVIEDNGIPYYIGNIPDGSTSFVLGVMASDSGGTSNKYYLTINLPLTSDTVKIVITEEYTIMFDNDGVEIPFKDASVVEKLTKSSDAELAGYLNEHTMLTRHIIIQSGYPLT